MDWNSTIKGFEHYLRLEMGASINTQKAYDADVEKLAWFITSRSKDTGPDGVGPADVVAFIHELNKMGIGERSQARLLSSIRAFYKYLLLEDLVSSDPVELIQGPRLPVHIPEVLSIEEVERFMDVIDLSEPHGHRNRAIFETMYACGLRVSEVIHLRLSHYYPEIGFVRVIGKNDKERIVPIGDAAKQQINFYIEGERRQTVPKPGFENHLFLNRRGKNLTRNMVFMLTKIFASNAGIDKEVSPHTFRHSFATHLVEGGADLKAIQDMLGHESITTTEIYTHLDMAYLRETLTNFHPSFRRK